MYLHTDGGQRILDAVGGAGTVVLGHGVRAITDAIARHGTEVSFCYGATFTNPWQEQLAEALVAMNSRVARRVYFVSGGSEGNETAVKMARQYHLQCGRPGRHKVIARWQSFHGSTLATLSLSGRPTWREPFLPMLPPAPHIVPPYCYRCPLGHTYPGCGVGCADDLERTILMEGPDSIAAAGLGAAPRAGPVGGRDPAQHDRRLDRVPAHRHAGHPRRPSVPPRACSTSADAPGLPRS